ncbi:hypothetical protein [Rhizobium leguminosarum]|uniref:hypothetical protein n=1 Tax=Rhizobium leguminosarum TaxID=384 RepID=UPI0014416CD0|nr:hypothetical protein [Rhizobium leguminosarum]MBY5801152.1 hypothetical protein [Rhizobium leguminosarum]NKL96352.1 hypothetical protein [Rhizobium leguminosarum bv. viciae]
MTEVEYDRLVELSMETMIKTGFHWFQHQFITVPHHLFAASILRACASIDRAAPNIGMDLLRELSSIGGRDRHEPHYEQLLQKLSEILVIERIVSASWPVGTTFEHEPSAIPGGPRPELLVTTPTDRLVVEVKTPSLLQHIRNRAENRTHLPYRGGLSSELAGASAEGGVTLPRDNPILDFLKDAERKFAGFRADPDTASLLVIVWDDHIYELISTLVNQGTGLLTPNSFAKRPDGQALTFPNIDSVVAIRHMHYFIAASRDEWMDGRAHAMDFGIDGDVPNVSFDLANGRSLLQPVLERLRAMPHDDPGLKNFAEYNPQDVVFWVPHSSSQR